MLIGSSCFDPQDHQVVVGLAEDGFSHTHYVPNNCSPNFSMDMEFQHQLQIDPPPQAAANWEGHMNLSSYNHQPQNFDNVPLIDPPSDLLNMLPFTNQSSISFANSSTTHINKSSNLLGLLGDHHDQYPDDHPLLPFNLSPEPPNFLRELIHSLPPHHGSYSFGGGGGGSRSESLFSGVLDEGGRQLFQDGSDHGVFEFTAEMNCVAKGRDGKGTKHFATEKQRRVQINDKYSALRSLVPNPTKNDRASVVGDAIDYINELKRTVSELKILVEKKRCSRERLKRQKSENASGLKTENDVVDQSFNGSELRSSWLYRKSKNTEVDVRIIDDEVTVKLVQQKRINCLLLVSKALDELQLDLHHVAGGLIGDYYSFFLNSKISEGSTVYAHAIANKLIDVMDKQYAAMQPTSSY